MAETEPDTVTRITECLPGYLSKLLKDKPFTISRFATANWTAKVGRVGVYLNLSRAGFERWLRSFRRQADRLDPLGSFPLPF